MNDLFKSNVENLIQKEFDFYEYHQGERNGQVNKKWLKTMFYSFIQQIIRQDLEYWLLYVCLRSDRNIRLINYFYYAKFVKSEDYTFFKHIDMNVPMYLKSDQGFQIIQKSIFLNDENELNCIEIVSEFHRHIEDCWKKIECRKTCSNDWMHSLEKIYIKKNVEIYENFASVSCSRESARMTMSKIFHESTHNIKNIERKTMLSWFVKIRKDDKTLDNEKSDDLLELHVTHKQHIAFALTSSGLINRYDVIFYKFFFSVHLILQSPVNNAIVYKINWNDSIILTQTALLFEVNRSRAKTIIANHRQQTLRAFKTTFKAVQLTKRLHYEMISYYNRKTN